jgi:AAA domain
MACAPQAAQAQQAYGCSRGEEVSRAPMEAVIFVGVQGSGKTSFYLDRFFDTHIRVSLDMLRTRLREKVLLTACLESRQPFVIDNTNPLPTDRARYIGPARAAGFRVIAYFFETSLRDAIRRNNLRAGKKRIPVPGVAGTFGKLQAPTLAEGFDALYTVAISADDAFVVTSGSPVHSRPKNKAHSADRLL